MKKRKIYNPSMATGRETQGKYPGIVNFTNWKKRSYYIRNNSLKCIKNQQTKNIRKPSKKNEETLRCFTNEIKNLRNVKLKLSKESWTNGWKQLPR